MVKVTIAKGEIRKGAMRGDGWVRENLICNSIMNIFSMKE
jgi:hypothetical protein